MDECFDYRFVPFRIYGPIGQNRRGYTRTRIVHMYIDCMNALPFSPVARLSLACHNRSNHHHHYHHRGRRCRCRCHSPSPSPSPLPPSPQPYLVPLSCLVLHCALQYPPLPSRQASLPLPCPVLSSLYVHAVCTYIHMPLTPFATLSSDDIKYIYIYITSSSRYTHAHTHSLSLIRNSRVFM